jgi:hypothetical protein
MGVDLALVAPSGAGGVVTLQDVKQAAAAGTARLPSPTGRGAGVRVRPRLALRSHPHPPLRGTLSRWEREQRGIRVPPRANPCAPPRPRFPPWASPSPCAAYAATWRA